MLAPFFQSSTSAQQQPMATNEDWLNLVQEPVLDPDLPIIDPHHHFWINRTQHTVEPHYLID